MCTNDCKKLPRLTGSDNGRDDMSAFLLGGNDRASTDIERLCLSGWVKPVVALVLLQVLLAVGVMFGVFYLEEHTFTFGDKITKTQRLAAHIECLECNGTLGKKGNGTLDIKGHAASIDHVQLIASYRNRLGQAFYKLLEEGGRLFGSNETTLDVGEFLDLVDDVVDGIGVRGAFEEIFNIHSLAISLKDYFYMSGQTPKRLNVITYQGEQGPSVRVKGKPNGIKGSAIDTSLVFWVKHWVGIAMANKLLQEGSLLLTKDKVNDEEHIHEAGEFMKEMHDLTSARKYPDIFPYHAIHGFWWHYVSATQPGLSKYPLDLFKQLCASWMDPENIDYNEHVKNSMYKECRHGVGHAVFYTIALRENDKAEPNIRMQPLENTFHLSDEHFCEALAICDEAPKEPTEINAQHECRAGLGHSVKLFMSEYRGFDSKVTHGGDLLKKLEKAICSSK
ncbi:hypothetical protein ACHAWF_004632 [Thalassiosira exigua]